jgi:hypothetical protein
MQEKHSFEYAVVRVVPQVEREEFINVGVVLYCPKQKFLQAIITANEVRLCAVSPSLDLAELSAHLCAFEKVCNGVAGASPISKLDIASRFRWLTAARSTIVQTSKVHPGLCTDAFATLTRLHAQLVL